MHVAASLAFVAGASATSFSMNLRQSPGSPPSSLHRRGTLHLEADYIIQGGGYYATIEVGTPGQSVKLHLDTGSSDTWVNSRSADTCRDTGSVGCDESFDPTKSTSFETVERGAFNISYLDQTEVTGDYFNDTVTIDGQRITNQRLGLARNEIPEAGLMGLGLSSGVSAAESHPAIVDTMASQGLIERAAFSVYLNHSQADTGTILFGGIDTEKFIGRLATLSLLSVSDSRDPFVAYAVHLRGLSAKDADADGSPPDATGLRVSAVLDTGSTLSYLPHHLVEPIWDQLELEVHDNMTFIDCKYTESRGNNFVISFDFGNATITVPLEEMILNTDSGLLLQVLGVQLEDPCLFGLQSVLSVNVQSRTFALLGDTFLRSAYVVFDAANHQIGIAQANIGSSKSNIVELKADETSFPDVQGVGEGNTRPNSTSSRDSDSPDSSAGSDDTSAGERRMIPYNCAVILFILAGTLLIL